MQNAVEERFGRPRLEALYDELVALSDAVTARRHDTRAGLCDGAPPARRGQAVATMCVTRAPVRRSTRWGRSAAIQRDTPVGSVATMTSS